MCSSIRKTEKKEVKDVKRMDPLIITASICGAEVTKAQNENVPYTIEEIKREAKLAYKAGASIIHLHVRDDNGNFRYEQPLFWVYYPYAREILGRERVFNIGNDASPLTWEDVLEMRFFSSYIFKASNVFDRRIKDYLSGVDILMEADKIKNEIFNMEHDLWSY